MTNVYLLALNNAELLAVMLEGYCQRGIYADRYTFMQGLRCACSVLSGGFYFFRKIFWLFELFACGVVYIGEIVFKLG